METEQPKQRLFPIVRFAGFTDAWEQRKLGEVTERITRKNSNLESDLPLTISAQDGLIDQRIFFDKRIASTNIRNYYLLQKGDFAYNKSYSADYPWGAVKMLDRYEKGVVSTLYIVFRPTHVDSLFLSSYYETVIWFNEVAIRAAEGARNHGLLNITSSDFFTTTLKIPETSEEQRKIGGTFENIDNAIVLHQRKLDQLKEMKKGLLQKMFPVEGEEHPQIRFAGFTDAWEQRKLSKICSMHARIGWQNLRTSEFLTSGDCYLITGTDFEDGRINFKSCHYVAMERYRQDPNIQISNGSILITKDGTLGKVAFVDGMDKPGTLNAGVFNVRIFDKDVSNAYLFQYLKAPFLMRYVSQKATGGTIKHLNQNILVDFLVATPKKGEQEKIGAFYNQVDNLLVLHQRKLDQLKEMKKALLQKMFI
jgi:type I restriction enzyme S subunit